MSVMAELRGQVSEFLSYTGDGAGHKSLDTKLTQWSRTAEAWEYLKSAVLENENLDANDQVDAFLTTVFKTKCRFDLYQVERTAVLSQLIRSTTDRLGHYVLTLQGSGRGPQGDIILSNLCLAISSLTMLSWVKATTGESPNVANAGPEVLNPMDYVRQRLAAIMGQSFNPVTYSEIFATLLEQPFHTSRHGQSLMPYQRVEDYQQYILAWSPQVVEDLHGAMEANTEDIVLATQVTRVYARILAALRPAVAQSHSEYESRGETLEMRRLRQMLINPGVIELMTKVMLNSSKEEDWICACDLMTDMVATIHVVTYYESSAAEESARITCAVAGRFAEPRLLVQLEEAKTAENWQILQAATSLAYTVNFVSSGFFFELLEPEAYIDIHTDFKDVGNQFPELLSGLENMHNFAKGILAMEWNPVDRDMMYTITNILVYFDTFASTVSGFAELPLDNITAPPSHDPVVKQLVRNRFIPEIRECLTILISQLSNLDLKYPFADLGDVQNAVQDMLGLPDSESIEQVANWYPETLTGWVPSLHIDPEGFKEIAHLGYSLEPLIAGIRAALGAEEFWPLMCQALPHDPTTPDEFAKTSGLLKLVYMLIRPSEDEFASNGFFTFYRDAISLAQRLVSKGVATSPQHQQCLMTIAELAGNYHPRMIKDIGVDTAERKLELWSATAAVLRESLELAVKLYLASMENLAAKEKTNERVIAFVYMRQVIRGYGSLFKYTPIEFSRRVSGNEGEVEAAGQALLRFINPLVVILHDGYDFLGQGVFVRILALVFQAAGEHLPGRHFSQLLESMLDLLYNEKLVQWWTRNEAAVRGAVAAVGEVDPRTDLLMSRPDVHVDRPLIDRFGGVISLNWRVNRIPTLLRELSNSITCIQRTAAVDSYQAGLGGSPSEFIHHIWEKVTVRMWTTLVSWLSSMPPVEVIGEVCVRSIKYLVFMDAGTSKLPIAAFANLPAYQDQMMRDLMNSLDLIVERWVGSCHLYLFEVLSCEMVTLQEGLLGRLTSQSNVGTAQIDDVYRLGQIMNRLGTVAARQIEAPLALCGPPAAGASRDSDDGFLSRTVEDYFRCLVGMMRRLPVLAATSDMMAHGMRMLDKTRWVWTVASIESICNFCEHLMTLSPTETWIDAPTEERYKQKFVQELEPSTLVRDVLRLWIEVLLADPTPRVHNFIRKTFNTARRCVGNDDEFSQILLHVLMSVEKPPGVLSTEQESRDFVRLWLADDVCSDYTAGDIQTPKTANGGCYNALLDLVSMAAASRYRLTMG